MRSCSSLLFGIIILSIFSLSWTSILLIPVGASPAASVHDSSVYEYYGYAPPSNFSELDKDPEAGPSFRLGWKRDPITGLFIKNYGHVDNGTCYLDVVGYNDSTSVQIFDITGIEPVLRESFTVDRMELHNTTIPAKTYFKVVSDKPVAVMAGGGSTYNSGFNLFYPSTDGGYAGKEFIFMAIEGSGRGGSRAAPGGTIHALEEAEVTVYDDEGKVVWKRGMEANGTREVVLLHRRVYRVVSTGRILVGTWSRYTVKAVPAALGGFKGTYFFVWQDVAPSYTTHWSAIFIVNQEKESHVKVIDLKTGGVMGEKDLDPRNYWFLTSEVIDFVNILVMIRSTNEVMVLSGNVYSMDPVPANIEPDVTVVDVRANEPTTLYVISKGIAFSPKASAMVEIGGATITVPEGGHIQLPTGLVTVSSNMTLIVEVISQPTFVYSESPTPMPLEVVALNSWGTYLMTAEGAELTYPPAKEAASADGAGVDVSLYGVVVAVVVVLAAMLVWKKPWGRDQA